MTDRFADRLAPETYRSDEPWGISLVEAGRPVDWTESMPDEHDAIPERIGQRLLALAQAYELHQLSTLEPHAQNRLNSQQAASLVEELDFLFERVNDEAL